jgi:hypothetical protein
MRRFTIEDMSNAIDGVMSISGATDKARHDIMRMIEHAWNGRGLVSTN